MSGAYNSLLAYRGESFRMKFLSLLCLNACCGDFEVSDIDQSTILCFTCCQSDIAHTISLPSCFRFLSGFLRKSSSRVPDSVFFLRDGRSKRGALGQDW